MNFDAVLEKRAETVVEFVKRRSLLQTFRFFRRVRSTRRAFFGTSRRVFRRDKRKRSVLVFPFFLFFVFRIRRNDRIAVFFDVRVVGVFFRRFRVGQKRVVFRVGRFFRLFRLGRENGNRRPDKLGVVFRVGRPRRRLFRLAARLARRRFFALAVVDRNERRALRPIFGRVRRLFEERFFQQFEGTEPPLFAQTATFDARRRFSSGGRNAFGTGRDRSVADFLFQLVEQQRRDAAGRRLFRRRNAERRTARRFQTRDRGARRSKGSRFGRRRAGTRRRRDRSRRDRRRSADSRLPSDQRRALLLRARQSRRTRRRNVRKRNASRPLRNDVRSVRRFLRFKRIQIRNKLANARSAFGARRSLLTRRRKPGDLRPSVRRAVRASPQKRQKNRDLRDAAFFRRSLRHCRNVPFSNVPRVPRQTGRVWNQFVQFSKFRINYYLFATVGAPPFGRSPRSVVAAKFRLTTRDSASLSFLSSAPVILVKTFLTFLPII